jgi:hypothetical protein
MLLKQNKLRLLAINISLPLSKYETSVSLFTTAMQKFYTAYVGIELVRCADESSREALH